MGSDAIKFPALCPECERKSGEAGFREAAGYPAYALSIRQPWAWLIVHAGKDIENRSWPTRFRGPVLIHAGKAWGREEREAREYVIDKMRIYIPEKLPLGGIVGRAEIVDCVEQSDSPWFFGPYGFVLRRAHDLTFAPCRGALGFFKPDNVKSEEPSDGHE